MTIIKLMKRKGYFGLLSVGGDSESILFFGNLFHI
jgi:hypothetical protein